MILKMNALVDAKLIRLLYEASMSNVRADLLVRGICCLRPGLKGEREYSRHQRRGALPGASAHLLLRQRRQSEIYMGSADLMPRNLDRRVETVFPVEDEQIRVRLLDEVLRISMLDNVKARELQPDGTYRRLAPGDGETSIDSQTWFMERARSSYSASG